MTLKYNYTGIKKNWRKADNTIVNIFLQPASVSLPAFLFNAAFQKLTIFNTRFDYSHNPAPAGNISCVKFLIMNHHTSLRKVKAVEVKSPAPVVHLRITGEKKGKQPEPLLKNKFKSELPLHHNERIFKAKKNDPL